MNKDTNKNNKALEAVELIKTKSDFLRGTIAQGLQQKITGSLVEDDTQLTKFHGIYQQHDRDSLVERRKLKLEPLYSFMIRARVAGGICTPKQWLVMDTLADKYANASIRLTTRQAFQLHGVLKKNLKTTIADINLSLLDTIAACGDVNRNVMCTPNPDTSESHESVLDVARQISEHLTPNTTAYHEIWLDKKKIESSNDHEPIYGDTYLPRKFKIVLAIPPSNDVDIFSHDLGFIAIIEDEKLVGFNITVGGGMGYTHGDDKTFPLLSQVIGFCEVDQVCEVSENVVKIQRDFGDRTNRKHARFKYTIDDRGFDWFKDELQQRLGWELKSEKPYEFTSRGDQFGWSSNHDASLNLTLFIENGRIIDNNNHKLKSAIKEIAELNIGEIRLTANQNLILAKINKQQKQTIEKILNTNNVVYKQSLLIDNAMACVAFPTCSLAMAEAERYLPQLLNKIENIQTKYNILNRAIVTRMTGCPNGCARPFLAEIGFVGKAAGRYNFYLGGSFHGDRLNQLYRENIDEQSILKELDQLLQDYSLNSLENEFFGDFVIRKDYVQAVTHGSQVHGSQVHPLKLTVKTNH
ncbi:MAG: NADPH-dependent assimilatory sulfite reductase hemoprotein subunit [Proteobacteria bacterium]|nr:NADPH-dependent assimilatory sulfite reductase hemoprotein subunit [Pseudomonadota bacterium]